jgi:hypothetical protein
VESLPDDSSGRLTVARIPVYLEIGKQRTFASSFEWPGWSRAGKGVEAALEALVEAGPRYRKTVGKAAQGFVVPTSARDLRVTERVEGNATTDFGAPGLPAKADDKPLAEAELRRRLRLLEACWKAFDRAATKAVGKELRKGPRGGGRELDAIVEHVLDADGAYLSGLGGAFRPDRGAPLDERRAGLRSAFVEAVTLRARGDEPPKPPVRAKMWPIAYGIRRSAWHAIDHVFEIEDRSG